MSSIFFKKCDFLVFFLWFFNCFYCFVLQPKGSVLLGQGYFLITFIPVIFFFTHIETNPRNNRWVGEQRSIPGGNN